MPITIDLTPEILARLHDKAAREGQESEEIAARLLAEALERETQDRQEAIKGIQRGLADFEAGQFKPLEEIIAQKRVKHGL